MKKVLVVLVVLVLGFSFVAALRGEEKVATNGGRFQLLQVAYTSYNAVNETVSTVNRILKIDTETGRTWYLDTRVKEDGIVQNGFFEIPAYTFTPEEKEQAGIGQK